MRAKLFLLSVALIAAVFNGGCLQEHLVIPVATVKGKVVVPPAKDPLGVKITVAGDDKKYAFVDELGNFTLEFTKPGRYLLIARGRDYDVNYVWVDAAMEKTVSADDIALSEKIVGEALWIATIVDFPDAVKFEVKSLDPKWATQTVAMWDDGTHGDKFSDDGIFAVRLAGLINGYQRYSLIWTHKDDGKTNEVKDPHREGERDGKSEIIIKEPAMKIARGKVVSALTGVNYSEVVLSTKGGTRKINLNSDGSYSMPMEGNGREYLVFRSPNFHIRAIPVDLSTMPIYEVPDVTLAAKAAGEAKFILIRSDFQDVATSPVMVADFTDWQPEALYDDGTKGDELAGDGVYTRMMTGVGTGYHTYAYNIRSESQVRDPYEESGDSQYSILQVK